MIRFHSLPLHRGEQSKGKGSPQKSYHHYFEIRTVLGIMGTSASSNLGFRGANKLLETASYESWEFINFETY